MDEVNLKLLILDTLRAQRDFVKFLKRTGGNYFLKLRDDEASEGMQLMERASQTIDRLSEIIDKCDTLTISDQTITQGANMSRNATRKPRFGVSHRCNRATKEILYGSSFTAGNKLVNCNVSNVSTICTGFNPERGNSEIHW